MTNDKCNCCGGEHTRSHTCPESAQKTKIVFSMPQSAAEKIAKDPQAFMDYMRANGFPVESVNVEIPKPPHEPDEPNPDSTVIH